jgi:hypothetical protein
MKYTASPGKSLGPSCMRNTENNKLNDIIRKEAKQNLGPLGKTTDPNY